MFQNIGIIEILIIAVVILLLFGASKLPEFARGMVEAKKEFKKSFESEDEKTTKEKTK
jgi:sec-independent protein translocase protein TatA